MKLSIQGLADLRTRLARLRPDAIMTAALATQTEHLAQSVRDTLSTPAGAGAHDQPWRRTGALHDSIQSTAAGLEAAIGSNDPAAAPQELGTTRLPPRPFLAPAAAASAETIATSIGQAVADSFKSPPTLAGTPPPD